MDDRKERVTFNEPREPVYETQTEETSTAKWFLPLVAAVALIIGALFIFNVVDADVDVTDPGSIDVDVPDVDVDVDVDVPTDGDSPDADADASTDGE